MIYYGVPAWKHLVAPASNISGRRAFIFGPVISAIHPRVVVHRLEDGSDTELLITLWGYSGAISLEDAGYETLGDA